MAVTFFWRCEGTTLSSTDDLPGADTSAAAVGSPAINATAALVGSNGIQIDDVFEYYTLNSEDAILNAAAGAVGFWFRAQSFTDDSDLFQFLFNSASNQDWVGVSMETTTNNHLKFQLRTTGVGIVTLDSTQVISVDTTYFVIVKWDQSASDRRIEIYNSSGTLLQADEDLTTGWTTPTESYPVTDGMQFGGPSAVANVYLDNFFIGTAYADGTEIYNKRNITTWATGRTTKNTRSAPLGMEVGMNWRGGA